MKSVRIPAKVARNLRDYLLWDLKAPSPLLRREWQQCVDALGDELRPKKFVVAAKKRVKARKAERQDEWAQIRKKVLARADGKCENCRCITDTLSPDHMFGGKDRRTLQSTFTVWALCLWCHRAKTDEYPGRETWLGRFIMHCANQASKYGDMAEDEPNGYGHAASIAKRKLGVREIQGRAGA